VKISEALVCDTSGLVALVDAADPDHAAVAESFANADGPFLVSSLVVAEVDHLLRRRCGPKAAHTFAEDIAGGAYELVQLTTDDLVACTELDRRYGQLGLSIADTHIVVIAGARRTANLLTLDLRHFRAVTPLWGGKAFRLLPTDQHDW
jgi:uncharacterized protein